MCQKLHVIQKPCHIKGCRCDAAGRLNAAGLCAGLIPFRTSDSESDVRAGLIPFRMYGFVDSVSDVRFRIRRNSVSDATYKHLNYKLLIRQLIFSHW